MRTAKSTSRAGVTVRNKWPERHIVDAQSYILLMDAAFCVLLCPTLQFASCCYVFWVHALLNCCENNKLNTHDKHNHSNLFMKSTRLHAQR